MHVLCFFFFKCKEGFYADCFKGILCFIVSEPGVHICNKFKGNIEPYWCILKCLKDCSRARLFKSFQTEFRQVKIMSHTLQKPRMKVFLKVLNTQQINPTGLSPFDRLVQKTKPTTPGTPINSGRTEKNIDTHRQCYYPPLRLCAPLAAMLIWPLVIEHMKVSLLSHSVSKTLELNYMGAQNLQLEAEVSQASFNSQSRIFTITHADLIFHRIPG